MSTGSEQRGIPGLVKRQLHFYWLLDTSGSMEGEKITALNEALRSVAPTVQESAQNNARGELVVHAIQFDDGARWVSADFQTGVPGKDFEWPTDLVAQGQTDLGAALAMVADELSTLPNNAFRPVICLVTDGQPSDNYKRGLEKLVTSGWGKASIRVAIAIGDDADLGVCAEFVGTKERPVIRAQNVMDIQRYIKWLSGMVSQSAGDRLDLSAPPVIAADASAGWDSAAGSATTAPDATQPDGGATSDDEWVNTSP